MARFECELFGLVQYSQELSYDELYEVGKRSDQKDSGSARAQQGGASRFLVVPGTACSSSALFPNMTRKRCTRCLIETAGVLTDALKGRLFCFDKHLEDVCVVRISSGKWQETSKKIPCLLDGSEQTHQSTCAQSRITD